MNTLPPRFEQNFIARRRMPALAGFIILLLGLAACAWVVVDYAALGAQEQALQDQVTRLARRAEQERGAARRAAQDPALAAELAQAAPVARALARDWSGLLAALERHVSPHVALLQLEPDGRKSGLRLQGEARNLEMLTVWLDGLAGDPALSGARLDRYEYRQSGSVRVVQFAVTVGAQP
ncbi:MAG: hypothetical protein KF778_02725 [Rhodocyclaceae bacterium]|nr:hypothetical protein [Rhodocyclaceae bacterium]MBX3667291.1 hypothetical protein [Rhodocyclaceae bacterium]